MEPPCDDLDGTLQLSTAQVFVFFSEKALFFTSPMNQPPEARNNREAPKTEAMGTLKAGINRHWELMKKSIQRQVWKKSFLCLKRC